MSSDLEPFARSVDGVFARLGLPDPRLQADLATEWDRIAGKPWAGRSKPLVVRGRTLVVEADSASMVAFLRYSEKSLLDALAGRFGEGMVMEVEVVAPRR